MNDILPKHESSWSRPYTFDRVVRLLISCALIVGSIWLINILSGVLLPFLVAWLISYMLEPFVQYNRRILRVKHRVLPVFMTLFEMTLIIIALGIFFVPSIMAEMEQVATLVHYYATTSANIPFIPQAVHDYLRQTIDFETIAREMTGRDLKSVIDAIGGVLSSGVSFLLGVFNWFIVILYIVFIMLDYERLLVGFKHLVPPKYRRTTFGIARDIKDSMNHYFRGQALVAFIVGVLFSIGFVIVGLPLGVVLGLFIGMLNLVPYLQLISIIPTTLLCLVYTANNDLNFWHVWLSCMVVYIVVQCIQDLFLTPRIMGKVMGLNPAIILLSLSIWGTLLGFIGLIIALPLTTLLLAYYNQYISHREDGGSDSQRRAATRDFEHMVDDEP